MLTGENQFLFMVLIPVTLRYKKFIWNKNGTYFPPICNCDILFVLLLWKFFTKLTIEWTLTMRSSGNEIFAYPREQQLVVYDRNNWQVILYLIIPCISLLFRHDKEESKMVLFNSVDKSLMICHSAETPVNHHNSHHRSPKNNKVCPLCKQSITTDSPPSYPQSPPREVVSLFNYI